MNISEAKLDLLYPQWLNRDGIKAWFTLKNASSFNESRSIAGLNVGFNTAEKEKIVQANRAALLNALDIDPDWIAFANQVHSNRIQEVSEGGTYPDTDGLITRVPGLALAIQVADCAAVLLGDAQHRIIAAVHAGWRGAAGNIVPRAIEEMLRLGAKAEYIRAFISPCISKARFEVGEEVAVQFPDRFVDYTGYEKPHVDLKGFLTFQMIDCGIKSLHIEVHNGCTMEDDQKYYSYRRDKDSAGRMAGIIRLD